MKPNGRVAIRKMYKLYINGAFARSESGRSDAIDGENVAHASRKDVRDAVVAARAATTASRTSLREACATFSPSIWSLRPDSLRANAPLM